MTFEEWWEEHGWVPISSTDAAKMLAKEAWNASHNDGDGPADFV
jgi:hypothetical protein